MFGGGRPVNCGGGDGVAQGVPLAHRSVWKIGEYAAHEYELLQLAGNSWAWLAFAAGILPVIWLAGAVGFVIGLSQMNSPATARTGNLISASGMAMAIGATAL